MKHRTLLLIKTKIRSFLLSWQKSHVHLHRYLIYCFESSQNSDSSHYLLFDQIAQADQVQWAPMRLAPGPEQNRCLPAVRSQGNQLWRVIGFEEVGHPLWEKQASGASRHDEYHPNRTLALLWLKHGVPAVNLKKFVTWHSMKLTLTKIIIVGAIVIESNDPNVILFLNVLREASKFASAFLVILIVQNRKSQRIF